MIGRFLATKPNTAIEWRTINDRISAEQEINPELRTINTVLMRSYDGLPYYLKSAFLYLSIFPEDCKIRLDRLVRRWIAEGYSRDMHGITEQLVFRTITDLRKLQNLHAALSIVPHTGCYYGRPITVKGEDAVLDMEK
ncbi:hypothetical protein QYE76_016154 [Lolium multiflorum]|uniref:Uncharacterized protein n=1 Tax=Lolium multiflorum TaxID=4521 RepID=A0AAD8U665_LOLMU|nr:hypothetical protein QYE76_016154 [Lolium multiflorum]